MSFFATLSSRGYSKLLQLRQNCIDAMAREGPRTNEGGSRAGAPSGRVAQQLQVAEGSGGDKRR